MLKLLGAFFRLIRWPNLLFIFLTQSLFYFGVFIHVFQVKFEAWAYAFKTPLFFLLSLSSVLIAAAGYIINDYFDLNIDRVNKPDKLIVGKIIKRRSAILWHWFLSGIGLLLSAYVSWKLRNPIVILGNMGCVILLWFYSTTFKRKLLIGNVIISLLTAWVLLVLYVCALDIGFFDDADYKAILSRLFKFDIVYAGFAFIISLVREVVKDIEDMEGDARYGCRTMPIVWGVNVAKVFAATWLGVLTGALLVIGVYAMLKGGLVSGYCLLLVVWLLWTLRQLYEAQTKEDFHRLSNNIKWIMLAGICSMIFYLGIGGI